MSIIKQNHSSCEIILIDDGSRDNSGLICDRYSNTYSEIRVIHQKNGGLSNARNTGMKQACGEYIMFLDSDDYLQEGCIERLKKKIKTNASNVIVGKAKIVFLDGRECDKVVYSITEGIYQINDYLRELKKKKCYSACAPFSIYKKSFLDSINASFFEGIIYEDELWTPNILLRTDTIYFSDEYFYINCTRATSITQSSNSEKAVKSLLTVTSELDKLKNQLKPQYFDVFDENIVSLFLLAYCKASNPERIVKDYGRYYPIKHAHGFKTKMMGLLYLLSPRGYLWLHKTIKGF